MPAGAEGLAIPPAGAPGTRVSTVYFAAPFDLVWERLADPLHFPRLFPRWTGRVACLGPGFYVGIGPAGDRFAISPRLSREHGVIDLAIAAPGAEVELVRSRLFPDETGGCVYVRLAVRRSGVDDEAWAERLRAAEADLEHARQLLEREAAAIGSSVSGRSAAVPTPAPVVA